MPNITGSNSADNIDVTDDDGTLNGTPQGTPIDNIRARGGNDTITVTNSTIANDVRGNGGSDDITITGSTVSGVVQAGAGGDNVSIEGSDIGNLRLGGGNDALDFVSTTLSGDIRGGSGTDALNLPVGTIINDATSGTTTVISGGSYILSNGSFTLPSGIVVNYTQFESGTGFPCFNRGTLLETSSGTKRIEQLKVGDRVRTIQGRMPKIRWIGSRRFLRRELLENPNLQPVQITAGALGEGLPERDLIVSQQHRMLVRSVIANRMFGTTEVLVPAKKLTDLPGIFVDKSVRDVEYFHLLFDKHEIVFAEGSPTESLYTGPEALKSISSKAREEIMTIFPQIAELDYAPQPACYIPPGRLQKKLIARHLKNNKPHTHKPQQVGNI
ncbi:MAG: Hint domain-containing protein [Paracoccaceae bacterium]